MPRRGAVTRPRIVGYGIYVLALVGAAIWTLADGPVAPALVLGAIPAFLMLRNRLGLILAAVLTIGAGWCGVLGVLMITSTIGVLPAKSTVVLVACVGLACALRLFSDGIDFSREDAKSLVFANAGGILWLFVLLAAAVVPGGSPISWTMQGDAANNILFARSVVQDGGLRLGPDANPVPLTSALIAIFMPHGTGSTAVAGDILALVQMWTMTIIAACAMSGMLVLSLIRRHTAISCVAVGIGSLAPLTWFMLAGSIGLGFVNFHLTLAVIVGALVSVVLARRRALAAFVALTLSLTLSLAVWAPLAGIPAIALAYTVAARWRDLVRVRGWRLVIVSVSFAQVLLFVLLVSLPGYLAQGSALVDATGAVFNFNRGLVAVTAMAAIGLGVLCIVRGAARGATGVLVSILVGGGGGLAALLWLRRNEEGLWGYYQLKFLWLLFAVLFIAAVVFGVTLASAFAASPASAAATLLAVGLGAVGVDAIGMATLPQYGNDVQLARNPLVRIVTGDYFTDGGDDRVFHRVVELSATHPREILWKSGDPDEASIMFWMIQMASSGVDDTELRHFAYYRDVDSSSDLCMVRKLLGPPVTVVTADPSVVGLARPCAASGEVLVR
jgi:hypothetical protein